VSGEGWWWSLHGGDSTVEDRARVDECCLSERAWIVMLCCVVLWSSGARLAEGQKARASRASPRVRTAGPLAECCSVVVSESLHCCSVVKVEFWLGLFAPRFPRTARRTTSHTAETPRDTLRGVLYSTQYATLHATLHARRAAHCAAYCTAHCAAYCTAHCAAYCTAHCAAYCIAHCRPQ
jgi:ABC-type Fe3+ transport system permease subunit